MDEQKKQREKFLFLPEVRSDLDEPVPEPQPEPAGIYPCPCCGCLTFHIPIVAAIAGICPVCFWENDVFDPGEDDPSDENGGMTLRQGRENFKQYGAARPDLARYTRPPRPGEIPTDLSDSHNITPENRG